MSGKSGIDSRFTIKFCCIGCVAASIPSFFLSEMKDLR